MSAGNDSVSVAADGLAADPTVERVRHASGSRPRLAASMATQMNWLERAKEEVLFMTADCGAPLMLSHIKTSPLNRFA